MLLIIRNVDNSRTILLFLKHSLKVALLLLLLFLIYNNDNRYKIDAHENIIRRTLFEHRIAKNIRKFNISDDRACGFTNGLLVEQINQYNCTKRNQIRSSPEEEIASPQQQGPVVGTFPSHVFLRCGVGREVKRRCNGILISDELVLTSAECLIGHDFCKATFGFYKHYDRRYEFTEFVWGYCLLKSYNVEDNKNKHNDAALLQLYKPIKFTDIVQPACLDITNSRFETVNCIAVGFVSLNPDVEDIIELRFETMVNKCDNARFDSEGRTCYTPKEKSKNLCRGNLGSGLYCVSTCKKTETRQYAVGLFSFKDIDEPIGSCQQEKLVPHYFSDFHKLGRNFKAMVENCYDFEKKERVNMGM